MNAKESAEFYRIGLRAGLIEIPEAIAWADTMILAEDMPAIEIIEVAISGSQGKYAVIDALTTVKGESSSQIVISALFKRIHQILINDCSQLPTTAKTLHSVISEFDEDYFGELYHTMYWAWLYLDEYAETGKENFLGDQIIEFLESHINS